MNEFTERKPFKKCFENFSPSDKKIKKRNYLYKGKIPIIDQGEDFIGGYTNDTSKTQNVELPVIIFGDHTRRFKFIDFNFAVGADGVKIIKVDSKLLDDKFAFYQLLQTKLPDKGYSRHFQFLAKTDYWAPENRQIQKRAVELIETQFTRLDAAIKSLKAIKGKLETYRKSVLKAAFSGELIKNNGSWTETSLSAEFNIVMGQSPESKYYNQSGEGLPFFQGKKEFTKLYAEVQTWSRKATKLADKDDVLLSIRAPIGPVNLAPTKCGIGRGLAAVKPNATTSPKLILYLLKNQSAELERRGTGTTFRAITKPRLYSLLIKIPSDKEDRDAILLEIESRFSVIDKVSEVVDKSLKKAERLRKSILKAVFEGKLVN